MKGLLCKLSPVLWLLFCAVAWAGRPDFAREQRMAEEIVDAILDGEPVELAAEGQPFLGIYTEAEQPRGSVLILHGRGFHPDWPELVQPLRVGLVERGWNTLSIQLPVLDKQAKYFDYIWLFPHAMPRIEAALDYLEKQGGHPVVIVAHSCGSHMAQHWIRDRGDAALRRFDAYVGIGMGATDYRQPMVEPFVLDRMPMPVLDVYGGNDYPAVLRMAPQRASMLEQAGNPVSRQVVVPGADHYFTDMNEVLVEVVAEWLDQVFPATD
jgi:pimeloyl-ACP methyl ester carboxylesterase